MRSKKYYWWLVRELPIDPTQPHGWEITVLGRTLDEAIDSAAEMTDSAQGTRWVAVRLTARQAAAVGLEAP